MKLRSNNMSLGERIKELRKNRKLTQIEFAKLFQISNGTIAMWETDKRQPDFNTLQKLADYFGVTTDYLLGREQPVEKQEISVPEKYKDVMVAFQDGAENLTQEDIDDVVKFIEFLKNKKK